MFVKTALSAILATLAVLAPTAARAEDPPSGVDGALRLIADVSDESNILTRIHDSNRLEVQFGMLALEKSQNDQVRDFAEYLIAEHAKAERLVHEHARKHDHEIVASHRLGSEYVQQLLERAKAYRKLAKLDGEEFDLEFLEMMHESHAAMLKKLEAAQSSLSDDATKAFVGEIAKKVRVHDEKAVQLRAALTD